MVNQKNKIIVKAKQKASQVKGKTIYNTEAIARAARLSKTIKK